MTDRKQHGVLWQGGGFRVTSTGLRVTGKPTLAAWGVAVRTLAGARSAFQWGVGDLLVYADQRQWDAEAVEEITDKTGLKRGTLFNLKSVAKAFPVERRHPALPWSHHAAVAGLADDDQERLLKESEEQRWGWAEVSEHARSAKRTKDHTERKFPEGTFGLLVARPRWSRGTRSPTMDTDAIAALAPRVQKVSAPQAVLYLWASNEQLDDAVTVLKAWGFTLRGCHVVVGSLTAKQTLFMRERHAVVLVGSRGRALGPTEPPDSVVMAEDEHELLRVLEHGYPDVPRILLFGEGRHEWTLWDVVEEEKEAARAIRVRHEEVPA